MPKSPEQFDFSKLEDQQKFEKLPKEKKQEIIEEVQEEGSALKGFVESGDAENFEHAMELLTKSKKSLDSYIKYVTKESVFTAKLDDIKKMIEQITVLDHLNKADNYSKMLGGFFEGNLLKIVGSRFDEIAANSVKFEEMSIRELMQFKGKYHFMLFSAHKTDKTIISQLENLSAKTELDDLRLLMKESVYDSEAGDIFKKAYITQLPKYLKGVNSLNEIETLLKNSPYECERMITTKIIEIENAQKSPDKKVTKIIDKLKSEKLGESEEEQLLREGVELKLDFESKTKRSYADLKFRRKVLELKRIPSDKNKFLVLVEDEGDRNDVRYSRGSKSLGLFVVDKGLNVSVGEQGDHSWFLETKEAMQTKYPIAKIVLQESSFQRQFGNMRSKSVSKELLEAEFDKDGVLVVSTGETKKYDYEFISVADKDVGGVEDEKRSTESKRENKYFYFDRIGENLVFESDSKVKGVEELNENNPELRLRKFKLEK